MCFAVHCRDEKRSLVHEQHSKHVEYRTESELHTRLECICSVCVVLSTH